MKKKYTYTRRVFIHSSLVTGLGLTLNLIGCKKSASDPDGDSPESLNITNIVIPSRLDVTKQMEFTIQGNGFVQGDQIIFDSLYNYRERQIVDVTSVTSSTILFILPEKLTSQEYRISVRRGTKTATLGRIDLNFVFNPNIPNKEGMTIKGAVHAAGVGLANVVVSDGFEVTKTDENGIYYLSSTKKSNYVFVSIPTNYEVATIQSAPQFFKRLTRSTATVETVDFELIPVNNDKHVVMVLGDMHLANRNSDIAQFQEGFLEDVNQSIQSFKKSDTKVYALTLGDMTWDGYWYSNNFGLPQYLQQMNKINAPVFNTMGNHDNDPNIINDWGAEDRYRDVIGPTYYSFNLGKVHYIVLDNIEYLNTKDRNYNATIVADQLEWLKKDLATLTDKNTPIIIAMHIQLFSNPGLSGSNETRTARLSNSQDFIACLSRFDNVHVLTGHTHMNYNIRYSSSIMEHNIAAVCATWWWTGRPGYAGNQICKDGTPGGYAIWEMEDKELKWTYKSIRQNADYQFRVYDLNKVHLTKEKFAPKYTGIEWNKYAVGYANLKTDNEILINVWNYDTEWSVEVTEEGNILPVTRVHIEDPLHIISYSAKRLDVNAVPTADFVTAKTAHMFKTKASSATSTLVIKVTDCFGKTYTQTMIRPKELEYLMT
ncbi:calcineurin-like phosphoesterase C-terminal domain-containing protein [Sphingobacterium chuzhouense]|uniref:Calcineurin-like phosphoesterase C-terminal domain-containing protein n=1 Tax=Sphingobacterium chuzhouense TaxID=1742264 RepID=A0ABR7XRP9_9SPHI|nr:calcineurin-like phosphoesterase family protein [Sphingobacterium chuzhouense]MBD1421846.1 calcineurin-like phosphoesterase C-terminal domain-containing protein [Sphingobacterium chuzhouense]